MVYEIYSGVDTIYERRGIKKENDIAKWEGKIEKSLNLQILFTLVVKYRNK